MVNDEKPVATQTTIGVLAFLVIWTIGFRLYGYGEPLERDITTYAVAGHTMLSGGWPYVAFWDHKPPAVYAIYAVCEWIVGYGAAQVVLLNVVTSLISLMGVYVATRCIAGGVAGLWAAAAWIALSASIPLHANQPNTEVILNACLIWVFALYVTRPHAALSWRATIMAGLLTAVASLVKHVIVVPVAFIGLASVVCGKDRADRVRRFTRLVTIGGIDVAAWALVWGVFAWAGHGNAFYEAVFTFNQSYAGSIWTNLLDLFDYQQIAYLICSALPAAVVLLAIGGGLIRGEVRPLVLLIAYAVGTAFAVVLPGKGHAHYLQLNLPVLSVSLGLAACWIARLSGPQYPRLRYAVPAVILALLWIDHLRWCLVTPVGWSDSKYGTEFISGYVATYRLDSLMERDETWYMLGAHPEVYFLTGRSLPARSLSHIPLVDPPLAAALTEQTIIDLERSMPDMIIVGPDARERFQKYRIANGNAHSLFTWTILHYVVCDVPEVEPAFLVCARKGSKLAHRLSSR